MIVNVSDQNVVLVLPSTEEIDVYREAPEQRASIGVHAEFVGNILHGAMYVPVFEGYADHRLARNIPRRQKGIWYVVPRDVAESYPEREDFVVNLDYKLFRMRRP